ncbi:MAG TPA: IS110 family transposase [Myxococcales bacterium]|nr:IS110 family transposase [Myxococcales bacterium]
MTADTTLTPETWLVAIDIGKAFHAVLVEGGDGKRQQFRMANHVEDYDRLVVFLRGLPGPARIALEPTGDFHRTLAHRLLREGFSVVSVSSVAGARYREALFNSWDKNDPKDAHVILQLLKHGLVQHYHDPLLAGDHDLQELAKTYHQIVLARKRLADSLLNHYLPLYFPEMGRYWESTRVEWFVAFLEQFPTPAAVQALPKEAFVRAAWSVVGRKVNKQAKLEELYELAQRSIALPVAVDSVAIETFRLQLAQLRRLAELRQTLEARAHALLKDRADFQRLCSLPGVAAILALVILAEGGDLRRFPHHRQFLKYCGLDLAKCQSGQFRGRERLSKRGNARLRMAFWMAAQRAVRMNENSFRDKYERYTRQDPGNPDVRRKALTAVAAKMARVAYAVVKHDLPYHGYHEHALPSGSIPLKRAVGARATP